MDQYKIEVMKLLGEQNWANWKFAITLVLQEKNLLSLVTKGSTNVSTAEEQQREFQAQRIIGLSLETSNYILACKSSHEMWCKLHEVFGLHNEMNTMALNEQFLVATKEATESMSAYVARLEEMARKLKVMKCPVAPGMLMTKVMRGLPIQYRHFMTSWESTAVAERTLPNLRARLVNEEDRLGLKPHVGDGFALAAKKGARQNRNFDIKRSDQPKSKFKCYKCHQEGHMYS